MFVVVRKTYQRSHIINKQIMVIPYSLVVCSIEKSKLTNLRKYVVDNP
jgi:hypothetical protein